MNQPAIKQPPSPETIRARQAADAEKDHAAVKANLPAAVGNGATKTAVALISDIDDVTRVLDEIAPISMAGKMVKFTKTGVFEVTSDGSKLSDMTDFRARCGETFYGYVKFNGEDTPPDRAMGPLYGGYRVRREDLGDQDEGSWETDRFTGKPRDPWIFQFWLVLEDVTTNELYTFVTSSVTGTRAVNNLLRHFNRMQETKPGADPIVRLLRSSYQHKKFGEVAIPMFKVTGRFVDGALVAPPTVAEEMDDEIPF